MAPEKREKGILGGGPQLLASTASVIPCSCMYWGNHSSQGSTQALAHWQAKEAPRIYRYWGIWGLCSWGLPSRTKPVFQSSTTTRRPPGLRKAAADSISKPALASSSSHPGQGQAGDHSACSFSSHRLGSPMMPQAQGYAHPPIPADTGVWQAAKRRS